MPIKMTRHHKVIAIEHTGERETQHAKAQAQLQRVILRYVTASVGVMCVMCLRHFPSVHPKVLHLGAGIPHTHRAGGGDRAASGKENKQAQAAQATGGGRPQNGRRRAKRNPNGQSRARDRRGYFNATKQKTYYHDAKEVPPWERAL